MSFGSPPLVGRVEFGGALKPYPTDVSDEEWSFSASYPALMDRHAFPEPIHP